MGLINAVVSDEPLHEDCARFSLRYCPHLHYEKSERRPGPAQALPTQAHEKPDRLYLIHADKLHYIDPVHTRFRIVKIYPYQYKENKLVPAEN